MLNIIKDRKIRFALVGCGRIAKNHFHALEVHQAEVELVAVCDNEQNALNAAVEKTGRSGFQRLKRDAG